MNPNWKQIFENRTDLAPPGYYSAIISLIKFQLFQGWSKAVIDLYQKEKKKKKKGSFTEPTESNKIFYEAGLFRKGSIVQFRNEPFHEGRTYLVKSDRDSGRKLIKIENTYTKSVQWVSEKRLIQVR
jgi:hypothetical protein